MTEFLLTTDTRKILHVDIDAFYAQVEMRDNPALRHQPLIISRDPAETGGRGVVTTANYVARQLGIHSAMRSAEARRLAPDGIFLTPDFAKYKAISKEIHAVFRTITPKIEPVAYDEAYLDVTDNALSGAMLAAQLRHDIYKQTRLTSSVGVSYNKLLAKLGSEFNKPNGVTVITPENCLAFLDPLPIGEFRGVGEKTQAKLAALNVLDGATLRQLSRETLVAQFGKLGENLYWQARGVHFGEVKWQRQQQSVGKEETFAQFLHHDELVRAEFKKLASGMIAALKARGLVGRTLNVKIRDEKFHTTTRAITQVEPWLLAEDLLVNTAQAIFDEVVTGPYAIRLLGLSMSNLQPSGFEEMTLF